MLKNMCKVMVLGVVTGLALLAGGCGAAGMGRYDLSVTPDASLREQATSKLPQVEVAIVGVKDADAQVWRDYKVDAFFSGSDPFRAGAKEWTKTLVFSNENQKTITIERNDPIWTVWDKRGVRTLFIYANSKNLRNTPGGPELRRKELPITTDRWKTDVISINVLSSGIDVPTPMETPK